MTSNQHRFPAKRLFLLSLVATRLDGQQREEHGEARAFAELVKGKCEGDSWRAMREARRGGVCWQSAFGRLAFCLPGAPRRTELQLFGRKKVENNMILMELKL